MAEFFDNRLDTSFQTGPGTGNNYATQNRSQITPLGVVGLTKATMSDGTPTIRSTIQPGARMVGSSSRLAMFAPAKADFAANADLIRVVPGQPYRLSLLARYYAAGSTLSALGDWGYAVAPYYSDENGSYVSNDGAKYSTFPPSTGSERGLVEREIIPPAGAAYVYLYLFIKYSNEVESLPGAMHLFIEDVYFGAAGPAKGGVAEVGASTEARLGIVSDVYSRSREKIQLKLAGVDDLVRSGHRIELAAAAMTSTPAVWHWRQVTGPTVALNVRENTCDFIAPDVERSTRIRIGVYAASEDGGNRSDWHYFDLDVEPPMLRFRGGDDGDFSPRSPYLVGYSRGKREIWNDVIRPATYEKNPRHELEVVDLGVPDDDVVFSTETPRRMAAGGVWVNPETGDVFRNFGAGYNETDDTTASPRTSTYWVNPANGDILEWIED